MFQIFVNVGMTVGIMPITGVPLPLLSYGGSSVLTTFLALGLLQSIYAQGSARGRAQGPRPDPLEKEVVHREKASARQRRPRGDPRGAAGGDRHPAPRRPLDAAAGAAAKKRPRRRATASPSSTSSAAVEPLDRRQHLQGTRRQRAARASRRRSSTSASTRTASCTSTRSCCPASRSPRRGRGRARARRSPTCSSPGQEVVVQVVKDPLKTKGARLSMELTIAGRYMVYAPTGEGVGVSQAPRGQGARPPAQGGQGARPRTAAARSSAPRPTAPSAPTSSASCSTCSSSTRCSRSASPRRPRRRSSSRRPTCRCASCATSSRPTSSARSSTTRSSTSGSCRSSRAPRPSSSTASSSTRSRRRCSRPTTSSR